MIVLPAVEHLATEATCHSSGQAAAVPLRAFRADEPFGQTRGKALLNQTCSSNHKNRPGRFSDSNMMQKSVKA